MKKAERRADRQKKGHEKVETNIKRM